MSSQHSANPFLSTPSTTSCDEPASAADPHDAEFAVLRSGPSIADAEVERADAEVIEVQVRWCRTVLGVAHVALDSACSIGEGGSMVLPEALLGAPSLAIVERGEIVIPPGAQVTVERDGVEAPLSALTAADASSDRFPLTGATKVRLVLGGDAKSVVTVSATRVRAGRQSPRAAVAKRGVLALSALTLVANVAFVLGAGQLPAGSLDDEDAPLDRDTCAQLIQLNEMAMMKERAEDEAQRDANAGQAPGGAEGSRAKGPPGLAGRQDAPVHGGHFAIAGQAPTETVEMRLAHTQRLIDGGSYGAIGALSSVFREMGPIDRESAFAIGVDPTGAVGGFDGALPSDAYGVGGKGTFGLADGGNGWSDGFGIGLKDIGFGTGGPRVGGCLAEPCGGVPGKHRPSGVKLLEKGLEPSGTGIPKDVIRRYVRGIYPTVRGACYEPALRRDPQLAGTVSVHFVIDASGAVETAYDAGSTMPDRGVVSCTVGAFKSISFPAPTSTDGGPAGKVSVTYPIELAPEQ